MTAAAYEVEIGGVMRPLLLRNGEIERFEVQFPDTGIFDLYDAFFVPGGKMPKARHVRVLVTLGLIGGGMKDRTANDLVASLPPAHNQNLYKIAMRLLLETFQPVLQEGSGKKTGGPESDPTTTTADTTPGP